MGWMLFTFNVYFWIMLRKLAWFFPMKWWNKSIFELYFVLLYGNFHFTIEWERLKIALWKLEGKKKKKKREKKRKKKIRDTKGTLHAKKGTIKDRNGPSRTKDIKKRWQEYKKKYTEKILMTQKTTMAWSLTT